MLIGGEVEEGVKVAVHPEDQDQDQEGEGQHQGIFVRFLIPKELEGDVVNMLGGGVVMMVEDMVEVLTDRILAILSIEDEDVVVDYLDTVLQSRGQHQDSLMLVWTEVKLMEVLRVVVLMTVTLVLIIKRLREMGEDGGLEQPPSRESLLHLESQERRWKLKQEQGKRGTKRRREL